MLEDVLFSLYSYYLLICYQIRLVGLYVTVLYSYIIFWINPNATGMHVSLTFYLTISTCHNLIDCKKKKEMINIIEKVIWKCQLTLILQCNCSYSIWIIIYQEQHTIQSFFLQYWYLLKDTSFQLANQSYQAAKHFRSCLTSEQNQMNYTWKYFYTIHKPFSYSY